MMLCSKFAQRIAAPLLSLALVFTMTGCKPTDLFTEVVITPFSDIVDERNTHKTLVNDPDATKESRTMTALDWTENSVQHFGDEHLVTYSDEPTSNLPAHHSVFDLMPRFKGIKASDPVRFTYSANSLFDHQSDTTNADLSALQAASKSLGSDTNSSNAAAQADDRAQTGESYGDGTTTDDTPGGTDAGANPEGDADSNNQGSGQGNSNSTDGKTDNPYAGYGGDVNVYDPGNGFARVNRVDHLGVIGTDVAVMVQSLGGAGAIAAMNQYAFYGLDGAGQRTTTFASFKDVFAAESGQLEQRGLLWMGDGSQPATVVDIEKLIAALGDNGLIVYDQKLGLATNLFSLDQRRALQAHQIQLAPVDMGTVQGILDAAQMIGEALSQSKDTAQDAWTMSRNYRNTLSDLVRATANTNGGYFSRSHNLEDIMGNSVSQLNTPTTTYYNPPINNYHSFNVYGYIAIDSESGLSNSGGSKWIDPSNIVLFTNYGKRNLTPLSFWQQAAGIQDKQAGWVETHTPNITTLAVIWPAGYMNETYLSGGRSGGALERWKTYRKYYANGNVGAFYPATTMTAYGYGGMYSTEEEVEQSGGLGSFGVPYLIVAPSDGKTAAQIKSQVVASMLGYIPGVSMTPYSALWSTTHYRLDGGGGDSVPVYMPGTYACFTPNYVNCKSNSIGSIPQWSDGQQMTDKITSPFYNGLKVDEVIRENPIGLLGSWTEGNMESVLEAVWLAHIYSKSPANHPYEPITDMSKFSVSIGGTQVYSARDAILQFYKTFYRVDASGVYNNIVTDEGV